jgi:hypothetical protein
LSITKADCEQKNKQKTQIETKRNQRREKAVIGTSACKQAPLLGTSLCSRRPPKPQISNNLHHIKVRVMKDPAKEHNFGSKEDIKKAQPEKLVGDTPEKPLPNTDIPCSLLPRKSTRKKLKKQPP